MLQRRRRPASGLATGRPSLLRVRAGSVGTRMMNLPSRSGYLPSGRFHGRKLRFISARSWNVPGRIRLAPDRRVPRVPRVEDVGAGHDRVREDARGRRRRGSRSSPRCGRPPGEQDRRRLRRLDRDRRVAQRVAARLVGPDLVARRAVRLERRGHRRRAPLVVVAVGVASPTRGSGRRAPSGTPSDVSARPSAASVIWTPAGAHQSLRSSWAKTASGSSTIVDVDRRPRTSGVGAGRRRGARAGASAAGVGSSVAAAASP